MRINILIVASLLLTQLATAQSTSSNPYSFYGLGDQDGLVNAIYSGMGNASICHFDSTLVNTNNPSSYNSISKNFPLFSFGLASRFSFYSENGATNFTKSVVPYHFTLALSASKHIGLAFGIKPYARKDYEFMTKELVSQDSIQHYYNGTGALNEAFLGVSTNILKFNHTKLAIGTNLGYLFGTETNNRSSGIIGKSNGGLDKKELFVKSFHYELGANLEQTLGQHKFRLGTVIEPLQQLNATYSDSMFYYGTLDLPSSYSLLSSIENAKGTVQIANTYKVGLAYLYNFDRIKKDNSTAHSELSIHLNYAVTDWTNFSSTFEHLNNDFQKVSTSKMNIGLQYTPQTKAVATAVKSSFFNRMKYRAGYYNYTLPYIATPTYNDQGFTFGFGMPIMNQNLSSLNIGFAYGNRSNGNSTQLSEQYYGFNIGIIIAPSLAERWFMKRKLD